MGKRKRKRKRKTGIKENKRSAEYGASYRIGDKN
jgi:hypothetical protein